MNLRKELAILIVLGREEAIENGGLGVVRIAELIGREKSQVSRTLKTLAESGFVDRDQSTLHYRLGWRFFALAARAGEQRLLSVAPPLLERLVKNLGETAHLSVLQGTEVLTVLSESPTHAVKADGWAGRTVPIYCTSSGRVLLFDHDLEALSNLLSGVEFRGLRPGTVRNVEELHESLEAARALGYALVDEEFEFGLVGAAARGVLRGDEGDELYLQNALDRPSIGVGGQQRKGSSLHSLILLYFTPRTDRRPTVHGRTKRNQSIR